MIFLDTSFLIRALVAGSTEDQELRTWLSQGETFMMSTVAWAEFLCGPLSLEQKRLAEVLVHARPDFTESQAALSASLFNATGRRRGSLLDCMIAAAAIEMGAPIATTNPKDFERFAPQGLTLLESTA